MHPRTITDMQSDHRVWLREIERWQFYLREWSNEHQDLLDGFARFQERIEQYGRDLKAHADAIEKHKDEILACERFMAEAHRGGEEPEPTLADSHAKSAGHHEEQHRLQEHLKRTHHTFLAQLGMLRHYPSRED